MSEVEYRFLLAGFHCFVALMSFVIQIFPHEMQFGISLTNRDLNIRVSTFRNKNLEKSESNLTQLITNMDFYWPVFLTDLNIGTKFDPIHIRTDRSSTTDVDST